jgi:sodium/bile acid cotransporter 7
VSRRHGLTAFVGRRWFLLTVAGGVMLAWLCPAALAGTGNIDPRFVVAAALFLMAWMLPSRQLAGAVFRPWPALWAFTISFAALPFLGWLVGGWLTVADFRLGLILIVCMPCTLATAILYTRMAGGDEATTLLTVLLTSSTAWLITPLLLRLTTGTEVAFDVQAMMLDLLLCLVVPVVVGQAARAWVASATFADRHRAILGVAAQLLILCIVLKAAAAVAGRLRQGSTHVTGFTLTSTILACALVHLTALVGGLGTSRGLGFGRPQQLAVAFACSQKTLPVAMLLLDRYFSSYPLAVVPVAFYHMGQLVLDTFVADHFRDVGSRHYAPGSGQ